MILPDNPNGQQISDYIEQQLDAREVNNAYNPSLVPPHTHNGSDSNSFPATNLTNNQVIVSFTLPGSSAATAANYSAFYLVPFPLRLLSAYEVHTVAGSSSPCNLNLERLTGTLAPNHGIALLSQFFVLTATANTVQFGTPYPTSPTVNFNKGDRVGLALSGTPTSVTNMTVTLVFSY